MDTDKVTFTLMDLGLKKAGPIQIFDNRSLCADGNLIPFNTQLSIVTHALMLKNSTYGNGYQAKAQEFINFWTETINRTKYKAFTNIACEPCTLQYSLFQDIFKAPFLGSENPKFTFIDLFAGIGGFRMALQNLGGQCVFSSEWDTQAQKTYFANYGEVPFGDITLEQTKQFIPDNFDILCAGFPCQAFSVAGYRRGFDDTRGTLFFDVAEIIKRKRPKVVFLENVKNLQNHDKGKTFDVIRSTMEGLGYAVYHKVMNACEYANIPQNRERIFIIGFNKDNITNHKSFTFPHKEKLTKTIHDCIDANEHNPKLYYGDNMTRIEEIRAGITSQDTVYQWRRQYVRENKSNLCPTLTANMGTGGHNVPLILVKDGIRKLSPKECLNFQGYPENFHFPDNIAESAKYKQAGNSVVVPLITKICKEIIKVLYPDS